MIVSILQLMGFGATKPVNSRASEVTHGRSSKTSGEGVSSKVSGSEANTNRTSTGKKRAPIARRQVVKVQSEKATKATKVVAPVKAAVKPKPTVKAKTAVKAKVVAKPLAAPPKRVKPKAVKVEKPKQTASAVAKAPPAKPVGKEKLKESVKKTTAKAAQPETAAPKTKLKTPAPAVKTTMTPSGVPVRAGRPSSRLAQLTVPSMAQSVASTAAKASFTQGLPEPYIVPPIASAVKKNPKLANNWKSKPLAQLTDAELIAMPDDEYMNETQLAYFRLRLSQLKKDILSNAGQTTEHLREDTAVVPDPADRATIEEEHALELRTRDRERKLLKKIEQSIVRIDSGDYGFCDETGEPIGVGRLLARPTANLSLEAQQRRELKQKMFGD